MTPEIITAALRPLKKAAALAQAEYRHAWDYGPWELEQRTYEKAVEARARYDFYALLAERYKCGGDWRLALHPANQEKLHRILVDGLKRDGTLLYPVKR